MSIAEKVAARDSDRVCFAEDHATDDGRYRLSVFTVESADGSRLLKRTFALNGREISHAEYTGLRCLIDDGLTLDERAADRLLVAKTMEAS